MTSAPDFGQCVTADEKGDEDPGMILERSKGGQED